MKPIGYLVMEDCEDFVQPLVLMHDKRYPPEGVLDWTNKRPVTLFPSRAEAMEAVKRTEYFRLAFSLDSLPQKRFCKIVPVTAQ